MVLATAIAIVPMNISISPVRGIVYIDYHLDIFVYKYWFNLIIPIGLVCDVNGMKKRWLSDERLKAISYVICTPLTAEWLNRVVLFTGWDILAVCKHRPDRETFR